MTVLNINNMYITTIADSYVQINYSLSLSLSLSLQHDNYTCSLIN